MKTLVFPFFALTLLLSWLVSNHYPPWVSAHSELLAAVAAGLLAAAALAASGARRIGVPAATVFFLLLATVPALQALTGKLLFGGDGWIAVLYLACAAWTVAWSSQMAREDADRWVEWVAGVLLAGALFSAAIAFVQRWNIPLGPLADHIAPVRPGRAPFGNLAQPNQLASLLALGLGGLLVMFERRRIAWPVAAALALLLVFTLAMTQSRTPLLFFVVALGWQLLLRKRLALRTPLAVTGGLAIAWCALFLVWPRVAAQLDFQVAASTADRLQAGPRTLLWPQLWDALWRQPWTGYGWNQVADALLGVVADYPESRYAERSHNLLLDLALWNGLPLALLIVGTALVWLVRRTRHIASLNGGFALLVIGLLLAHSMVEFPLEYLYFLVPFAIAIGVLGSDSGVADLGSVSRRAGVVAVAAFVAVTAFAAAGYWRMEHEFREMRFTVGRVGRPMVTEAPPLLSTQFTQLAAFHHFALTTPRPGADPQKIEWMETVARRYPDAPVLYRYALVQALNGDPGGATLTLKRLKTMHGDRRYDEARRELAAMAETEYPVLRKLQLP